jgi:predicted phage-related endonuclease
MELERRRSSVGASDATIIMTGTPEEVFTLWGVKTGRKPYSDLSDVLPVQIGIATESLNLDFAQRKLGMTITRSVGVQTHPDTPWLTATPDGWLMDERCPVEAKHVNQFSKIDDVVAKYAAQIHVQMMVTDAHQAYLSVIIGTMTHEIRRVHFDWAYAAEVRDRCETFWRYVQTDTPPLGWAPAGPPVEYTTMRTVSMQGHNEWAVAADDWLGTRLSVALHDAAKATIKGLVEADVRKAEGHGITVTRAKNGAITIKEA